MDAATGRPAAIKLQDFTFRCHSRPAALMEIMDKGILNTIGSRDKYVGSHLSGAWAGPGWPKTKVKPLQDQGATLTPLQSGMP